MFLEQILQGFRVYKTISHVTSVSSCHNPVKQWINIFIPVPWRGKLHSKKGSAGPQATVFYSHSGAGSATRVSCPPALTPLFCFTHQSQDLRTLHSGSNQASSNNVASKVVFNFLNLIILMRINVTHPLICPFGQMHLIFYIS